MSDPTMETQSPDRFGSGLWLTPAPRVPYFNRIILRTSLNDTAPLPI